MRIHEQCRKDFVKALEKVSGRYHVMDVFSDVCALMACACERLTNAENEREERYKFIMKKYTEAEREEFPRMFAMVTDALEHERKSFLGPVLEEIGAANKNNGQFLTPSSVAGLIARVQAQAVVETHKDGELITLNDSACGCGVLMIEGAEALLDAGIPQRDIMIYCGDIDLRALDATFVELTLLGYAARCDHMDALEMRQISRPRWTVGYFMYGTQWREGKSSCTSTTTEEPSPKYGRAEASLEESTTRQEQSSEQSDENMETSASTIQRLEQATSSHNSAKMVQPEFL